MRKSFVSVLVVFALLGATGLASAAPDQPRPRKDLQIFNDVSRQVLRYAYFTIFDDVNASVDNGVVTLTGKVTMPFKSTEIQKRVAKVDGVTQVVNKIQVLPVSMFDDGLRYQIARAIYGNPSFWNYAAMVNPPIHIIVENGRVTLTGVVNSNVERMLARSIATQFDALSVKNDLKTDAEVQAALEKVA
jgi:hyperosmotically inducible protein